MGSAVWQESRVVTALPRDCMSPMTVFSSDVMATMLIEGEDRECSPQMIILARPFPERCGLRATCDATPKIGRQARVPAVIWRAHGGGAKISDEFIV